MQTPSRAVLRALALALVSAWPSTHAAPIEWATVINNTYEAPGAPGKFFHKSNEPSVSSTGLVVMRSRAKVPETTTPALAEEPSPHQEAVAQGIWVRSMATPSAPVVLVAQRRTPVPPPNNQVDINGAPVGFVEFPSFPRVDAASSLVVTRAQSDLPAYGYVTREGAQAAIGTTGVYVHVPGTFTAAANMMGGVGTPQPDATYTLAFPEMSVPGAPPGTHFSKMPGPPTAFDATRVAFRGHHQLPGDTDHRQGVYYRDVFAQEGKSPVRLVAAKGTRIPDQPEGGTAAFGAIHAPSGAAGYLAFAGGGDEVAPAMGGVYGVAIPAGAGAAPGALETLAAVGQQVAGEPQGVVFSRIGEAISISEDGRHVAFWGAWGAQAVTKTVLCVDEGNKMRVEYCRATYPDGYTVDIPVDQGLFVADVRTKQVTRVARTGEDGISDFLYWKYVGHAPGEVTDESRELPHWSSPTYAAIAGAAGAFYGTVAAPSPWQVAFKASRNGTDGIYLRRGSGAALETVVEATTSRGIAIDPAAPSGSIVTDVGLERDGFRHENLVIVVDMASTLEGEPHSWQGIYLGKVRALRPAAVASSPGQLEFGDVAVGADRTLALALANSGEAPASLSGFAILGEGYSLAANDCPAQLHGGASCSLSVRFAPTAFGPRPGTLLVTGATSSVALSGNGVASADAGLNAAALIAGYYSTLFGRSPEPAGLAFWAAEFQRLASLGADPKDVFPALARTMMTSPEYLGRATSDPQFVTDLYATFLGRAPDAAGLAFWTSQLAAGVDRRMLVTSFVLSPEYSGLLARIFGGVSARPEVSAVIDMYRGFLGRLPDSGGFAFWVARWREAQCAGGVARAADEMSGFFLASEEFAALVGEEHESTRAEMAVTGLYDVFMRRGADAEGFGFWVGRLETGAVTLDEIRAAFISSPEFQSRIEVIGAAACLAPR